MANSPRYGLADRHFDLLGALAWGPLSTRQLVKLSQSWPEPFPNDRQLRSQMQRLARERLVVARPFAMLTSGNPENYYQLTPSGFRLLFGDVPRSSASLFKPLPLARQAHQRALMDFLAHTAVAAHRAGAELVDLHPENSLVLSTGLESIRPDATFALVAAGRRYQYYLEIDNATAALAAARPRDSIGQKLRVYEAVQDQQPDERFRVLIVSVRPTHQRLANIRRLAATLARNPLRTLCLTCALDDFLVSPDALASELWLDHRDRRLSLLPLAPVWPQEVFDIALTAVPMEP